MIVAQNGEGYLSAAVC